MKVKETLGILKALSDRSRLTIVTALLAKPQYVEELAERLDLTPATVSFHLKKLVEAGLVKGKKEQYYTVYSIKKKILNKRLMDLITVEDNDDKIMEERMEKYRKNVIKAFFRNGKLIRIPAQLKKRVICLEEMARMFESGRQYTEKEVNLIIADFNDDFCTIRREFIACKIMQRKAGIYWLI